MSRLMAQDLDQEVKDCAISCMAAAVSQLGDVLKPQLPQILQVWVSLQAHTPKTQTGVPCEHVNTLMSGMC